MDTGKLIKYASIALALYLAYNYFVQPAPALPVAAGGPQPLPPQPQPQPNSPQPQPHPSGGGTVQTPTSPTPSTSTAITEANLIQWATDQAAAQSAPSSVLYTADQWNYYRDRGGRGIIDALLMSGVTNDNRGTLRMTAQEYWSRMLGAGGGLSGLGQYSWLA